MGQSKESTVLIKLTKRKKEELYCIYNKYTIEQTAKELFISPKTVETHRTNLIFKLGAKNIVGIVKSVMQKGLLEI